MSGRERKARYKQVLALARARAWRGNFFKVRDAVVEAAGYRPISPMQWYQLRVAHGPDVVDRLQAIVGEPAL